MTSTPKTETTLPVGDEKRTAVQLMFDTIAPRYDLVNRLMTFRMDVGWRRTTIETLDLSPAATVLDLACGTGDFARELTDAGHNAIGVDLSIGMLQAARTKAPLVHGDLVTLPLKTQSVDAAVCGFALRNLVGLEPFFFELARVVRPGGTIALLDVSTPTNPILKFGHQFYFGKIVPRIGGLLSDRAAYAYLPKSVSYLPDWPEMRRLLVNAGFANVHRRQLSGGISQLIFGDLRAPD